MLWTEAQGSLLSFSRGEGIYPIVSLHVHFYEPYAWIKFVRAICVCGCHTYTHIILGVKNWIVALCIHLKPISFILLFFRFYRWNGKLPFCVGDVWLIPWNPGGRQAGTVLWRHSELHFNIKWGGKYISAELFENSHLKCLVDG